MSCITIGVMHEIIESYRCITAAQVALLTGDSSLRQQNTRKKLSRLNLPTVSYGGKNVYLAPGHGGKLIEHDLLITDLHVAVRDIATGWRQTGIRDGINPDAYFVTAASPFFLELENSNPSESPVEKARSYARYADERKHLRLCENFRVLFVVPTQQKAENLERSLASSGIPNLGRFWVGFHDQIAGMPGARLRCPNPRCSRDFHLIGRTTPLPAGAPPYHPGDQ